MNATRRDAETTAPAAPPADGRPLVGWREWVSLGDLGVGRIKAKVDTGARSCALHAINIQYIARHGHVVVRFDVHPSQREARQVVRCEAPLLEERHITDSGGKRTLRPVIETPMTLAGRTWIIELTLISRDSMGFRMLIGRQALKGRVLVDPGRSYLGRSKQKKKLKKRKKIDAKRLAKDPQA